MSKAMLVLGSAFACSFATTGAVAQIGSERAVPVHLQDGEEYTTPIRDLIRFGERLFTAMWTVEDGGGRPLTKESFGNLFRDACRDAKVPGSARGLRKTRATIEVENGASGAKLDALFGWRTGSKTSAIYIRKADRARLAFGPVEELIANIDGLTAQSGEDARGKKR